MNDETTFKVAPTMVAPIATITRVEPERVTDCSKCEGNINVGVFFDGTNNNRADDMPDLKHTNVARLFDTYWNKPTKGYFPSYIPGVGTQFPGIREAGTSTLGNGFGNGCEHRVLFALLSVFNAIHAAAFDNIPLLSASQIAALCCNSLVHISGDDPDSVILGRLGQTHGLLIPTSGPGRRVRILKDLATRLETALVKGRPRIKECFIDVFGFSRGAAQARVFCNWLNEILVDRKLAGVIIHFRFLGVMDTVASAGLVSSVSAAATGADGGHSGWAEACYLRIPDAVQNCVHMIAGHELRKNFPVDTITVQGKLPARCQEFVYPGAHSDVGGGYAPGDLGIAFDPDKQVADSQKLAQIPLNHMLECAIAAGAPMKKDRAIAPLNNHDPFAIAPVVQKAYNDYVTCSTLAPRPLHEWLQPYLNWRWQVRLNYARVNHVSKATEKDRTLLFKYNDQLIADAAFLDNPTKPPGMLKQITMPVLAAVQHLDAKRAQLFEEEARTVLAIAKAAPTVDARLSELFNRYVHDSLAGFDKNLFELSGYWRYRRGYLGDEKRLVVDNDDAPAGTNRAAA